MEQSDLDSYWLQFRVPKYISTWESKWQELWTTVEIGLLWSRLLFMDSALKILKFTMEILAKLSS